MINVNAYDLLCLLFSIAKKNGIFEQCWSSEILEMVRLVGYRLFPYHMEVSQYGSPLATILSTSRHCHP